MRASSDVAPVEGVRHCVSGPRSCWRRTARSSAPEIARVLQTDENQVRRVIGEFNTDGMASLRPPTGGGRPRRIDDAARERIRAIALARPGDLGEPGTRWSLATLRRYLIRHRVVERISKEHLRRILQSMGITAQRTRTWKWSNDPLFEQKKDWVLAAYQGRRGRHSRRGRRLLRRVRPDLAQASRRSAAGSRRGRPGSAAGHLSPPPRAHGSCSAPMTSAPTGCGAISRPGR